MTVVVGRWRRRSEERDASTGGLFVLIVLLAVPIQASLQLGSPRGVASAVCAVAVGVLFVVGQCMTAESSAWQRYSVLVAGAAASLVGLSVFGSPWVVAPVLTAVTCATVLPLVAFAAGGVVVTALAAAAVSGQAAAALVVGGAGAIAVLRARLMAEIAVSREGRAALARAAVENERLRISRDLHDLLGHSLATMVVKAELAEKLAPVDPASAAQAARDVQSVGRAAMVEVGEAVTGYRTSSLSAEIDRARDALESVTLAAHIAPQTWSSDVDAVLGWAVREATTNVVRHADATRVDVTVETTGDRVILRVVNDDNGSRSSNPGSGHGLIGLTERVEVVGGTVVAARTESGFQVEVSVPIEERS